MTTSIIKLTISPDLIITTPEQLRQVFTQWYADYGFENSEQEGFSAADTLISYLDKLNNEEA